jgi:hypothetical protein
VAATAEPVPLTPERTVSAAVFAPDRLLVGIVATGPCWVSVTVDGRPIFARELRAGERELLEVKEEVVVTAGDAAALRLTLNGREARPLGGSGRVATVTMNLTNFKDYLIDP